MTANKARLIAAVCFGVVAVLLSIFCAENARAEDRGGYIVGWTWTKGCTVTYVNRAPSYGVAVHDGLWALEASTGIDFVEVPNGPADLTFTEHDTLTLPGFETGWIVVGYYDFYGNVKLTTASRVFSGTRAPVLMRQVITHEVGHFLGLSHIDEPWSLMNVNDPRDKDGLSVGDVTRLQAIGRQNGCLS